MKRHMSDAARRAMFARQGNAGAGPVPVATPRTPEQTAALAQVLRETANGPPPRFKSERKP